MASIREVVAALSHVEEAVMRLSLKNATLASADIALRVMIRLLTTDSSSFSHALAKNLGTRLLQRRSVASRAARFVHTKQENTPLDEWLAQLREEVSSEGNERITRSFLPFGDISSEISRFHGADGSGSGSLKAFKDEYERFMATFGPHEGAGALSTSNELPKALTAVLTTLQPTSVPAERSFSKARHAHRYCQERQDDQRFANYHFLKDFYSKMKP